MSKLQKKNRSKKKLDFFDRVYKVTQKIPRGKVTTYGAIAESCGIKSAARTVGWAMNSSHGIGIPAHRVVNRYGALTGKVHFGDPNLMEDLLRSEGVTFNDDGCVNMKRHFWQPPKVNRNRNKS